MRENPDLELYEVADPERFVSFFLHNCPPPIFFGDVKKITWSRPKKNTFLADMSSKGRGLNPLDNKEKKILSQKGKNLENIKGGVPGPKKQILFTCLLQRGRDFLYILFSLN